MRQILSVAQEMDGNNSSASWESWKDMPTMYLAFFTMIPIRAGMVHDIRNQINRKITQLPLGFFVHNLLDLRKQSWKFSL